MEVGVAQALGGEAVHDRGVDVGAEATELGEADVVQHDEEHVGRPVRRAQRFGPPRRGLAAIAANYSSELCRWFHGHAPFPLTRCAAVSLHMLYQVAGRSIKWGEP